MDENEKEKAGKVLNTIWNNKINLHRNRPRMR
jgi:hypothetical protein